MAILAEVVEYTNQLLSIHRFKDYCPNGLQIEGRVNISRLATAVTASQLAIERAADWGADVLLVHHGYFWKSEPAVITGMKQRRIRAFLQADMSLLAYHLPLDAHAEYGNNVCIGRLLGIENMQPLYPGESQPIGLVGKLPKSLAIDEFVQLVEGCLQRKALTVSGVTTDVQTIAWCTGAAQHMIDQAVVMGADVFLSGEISEQTVHVARECGIHYVSAGHHATERVGVQALAEHLAKKFSLEHRYIEVENPV